MLESYTSLLSKQAIDTLEAHYDAAAGLYKFWASPASVVKSVVRGWNAASHPAQLHYAWDLETARSLDEGIRETTRRNIALLNLRGTREPRILDAGCGIGGAALQIATEVEGSQVVGVSIVAEQIVIATERARSMKVRNAKFEYASYLKTPFPDESFDAAYGIESFCYTPTPEKNLLFAEMYRILKKGGHLGIVDGVTLREPKTPTESSAVKAVLDGWTAPLPTSLDDLISAATNAGFSVVSAYDATSHVLKSARRIEQIARYVLRPLSNLVRWHVLARLLSPLGFGCAEDARRFADACIAQRLLLETGVGGYVTISLRK